MDIVHYGRVLTSPHVEVYKNEKNKLIIKDQFIFIIINYMDN